MYSTLFDPVYSVFKGLHKVQRVSPTEKNGRRHSSSIIVSVIDAKQSKTKVNRQDVKIDTYRDSGPGGQHRNKTDSAVRIYHYETGITVTAVESRSQQENREVAWSRLLDKIEQRDYDQNASDANQQRSQAFEDYNSWIWTDWRDEVKHGSAKYSMRKLLKGRLDDVLDRD